MDENLLGYLLNALEPEEHLQVEAYLRTHPESNAHLERLRRTLAPLALAPDVEPSDPPKSLALGTFALIAEQQCRPKQPPVTPPAPPRVPLNWSWLRRVDLLLAACVVIVLAGLGTTWITRAQQQQQVTACQNNLRLWWHALERYSDLPRNAHRFPRVKAEGSASVAGIFVPILNDDHLITPDMSVGCPAAGFQAAPAYGTAELEHLYQTDPCGYQALAPTLAKDYAYTLGYRENGQIYGLSRDSGDLLPLLADRPPFASLGGSPNHGGHGQNVLYIGGQVRWCSERTVGVEGDDIYLNKYGQLEAGDGRADSVLAPSEATPTGRRCHWHVD